MSIPDGRDNAHASSAHLSHVAHPARSGAPSIRSHLISAPPPGFEMMAKTPFKTGRRLAGPVWSDASVRRSRGSITKRHGGVNELMHTLSLRERRPGASPVIAPRQVGGCGGSEHSVSATEGVARGTQPAVPRRKPRAPRAHISLGPPRISQIPRPSEAHRTPRGGGLYGQLCRLMNSR